MARVAVKVCAALREHFGASELHFELPEGATLRDLLERIGTDYGERLAGIWNREERRFRGPVVIMAGARAVRDRATPLADGQTVGLFKAVVGG